MTVLLNISISHLLHVVGFGIITQWFVIRFFCTTARTFYEDFSSYTLKLILFLFIKIDCIIVTLVGFCVISPWSLSRFLSNHQKYSYDSYSIYIAIFNSFHEAIYPVGVTTNRSCFMRKSVINPEPFIRFPPNVILGFAFGLPFHCVKFQGDRSTHLRFIAIFTSVRKDEEERKKIELWQLVSQKWL